MSIVETSHFLARWTERVGRYYPRVRKLIFRSIRNGKHRRHRKSELGILVPITFRGKTFFIVGVPERREFILRTVLTGDMASGMGWNR